MNSVLKDDYTGYRRLVTARTGMFVGHEPVDKFGDDGSLNEFHYDLSGFFEIKFDKTVVMHIGHFLQYKFDADVKRQDVVLLWQKRPSEGHTVDNIVDDAERLWSLAKEHYFKSVGRHVQRRT